MKGAKPADYLGAASAALASDQSVVAEQFLWEGRQRWPGDPDLLHMTARQDVSHGRYPEAERNLRAALVARVNRDMSKGGTLVQWGSRPPVQNASQRAPEISGPAACRAEDNESAGVDVVATRRPEANSSNVGSQTDDEQSVSSKQLRDEIDVVRHRNASYGAASAPLTFRSGDAGFNRLLVQDSSADALVTVGNKVRVGVQASVAHLFSGTPDGASGYRFGTLLMGETFPKQMAIGSGGEVQVSSHTFGLAVGTPMNGFLLQNWTGGVRFGRPDGPIVVRVARENVKDSLLSYAGARDPGTGFVWGGVTSNSASTQLSRDESGIGQYLVITGGLLRGENVADNWTLQGTAGAYWQIARTAFGGLTVGVNATGMHYERNLNFYSLGQGGYFSPQKFLVGSVPLAWREQRHRVDYEVSVSGGSQYSLEKQAPFYPLQAVNTLFYDETVRRGPNYNVQLRMDYQITPYAYWGVFAQANNTRNFNGQAAGVTLRILMNRLPATTDLHLRTIPDWKGIEPFKF
jgi:hypothetical protein